jgi:hypothetical protein
MSARNHLGREAETMKFLLLCCSEEKKLESIPKPEMDLLMEEMGAYCEALRKSGHLIVGEPLESVQTAMTVRVQHGRASVTDGPFAETKEQLGGFFFIQARDLNEAIQVASRFPSVRHGSMEVRPVRQIDHRPGADK